MQHRPNVTTIVSHFLPGFKAGGPIRSVANVVARLGDEFDFRILTRDRDLGDGQPYPNVPPNEWQQVGLALVAYLPPTFASPLRLARLLRNARPDVLYVNSFFDGPWCITSFLLSRLGVLGRTPVIIAPRGQFGAGALQFKPARKKSYLVAFKSLGLTRRVIWQATCQMERNDIHRIIGPNATVVVAPNLSDAGPVRAPRAPKMPGRLSLAYYSRVAPKKNLLGAIELLRSLPGQATFDIWGPIEDAAYERCCQKKIGELPNHIDVQWRGLLRPDCVADTLAQYDAMLLPTHGENFGHVIVESLAAGCPVVISDRTPWRGLTKLGVGWDLPLDCPEAFAHALAALASTDEPAHRAMRSRAVQYASQTIGNSDHVDRHRQMFQLALDSRISARDARLPQAA